MKNSPPRLILRVLGVLCGALSVNAVVHAQITGPRTATLTPLVASDSVHAASTVHVALRVSLPEGYHTNSNSPRDPSLIPLSLTITPPAEIGVEALVFPEPVDLKQQGADQPLSVFERDFVVGVSLRVAASASPGTIDVPAELYYQACDARLCYLPVRLPVSWSLHIAPARDKVNALHDDVFDRIDWQHGLPPGQTPAIAPRPSSSATGSDRTAATLDDFTVLGTTAGYLGSADFLQFIHDAENGVKKRGMLEGRGPLAILLIVFVGGLALNLTPCVLPMIPINLAIIGAGTRAGSRGRGFLLGGAYGAAMAAVYGVLGLVVILTAGTFGTINSSPWFNLTIAAIFVMLALAMFDIVTIDFSSLSTRFTVGQANRGSLIVAFAMGAVAALLAGACVAPVVVQVVLFSSNLYAAGTSAALALPFVLGVGMALPWPIAGAGIAWLPKPGPWMVRIKQVFGVLILATAVYYGYEAYLLFANRWVDAADVSASVQEKMKEGWHPLSEGLSTAKREQKPVLIDMWATWCKNCLAMDKTTLEDETVMSALSGYVKIKFQAEDPEEPSVKQVMRRFNAVGLPTYVILKPNP